MEQIVLFTLLFMQAACMSLLCLRSMRGALRIPYRRVLFQALAVIAAFSIAYSFIPPRNWMAAVLVSIQSTLGWLYACSIFNEPQGKVMFCILLNFIHLFLCNMLWLLGSDVVAAYGTYSDTGWYNILLLGVPLAVLYPLTARLLQKLWATAAGLELPWYRVSLIPLCYIAIYITGYLLRYWGHINLVAEHVIMFTLTLCFCITVWQVFFSLSQAVQASGYAQSLRIVENQINLQAARVEEIKKHEGEIRLIKHDFRQHMVTLYAFLAEGKTAAAEGYLAQFVRQVEAVQDATLCENEVVDTMARYYIGAAEGCGIAVGADIALSRRPGVSDVELCVLLGNLFENAIEACEKLQKGAQRTIDVKIRQKDNCLLLSVRNTFNGRMARKPDGSFQSLKPGGANFGMQTVERIANRHSGQARFYPDGSEFVAEVLLYPDKAEPGLETQG